MSKLEAAGRGVMQYGREVEKRTWHCADAAEEIEEALAQIKQSADHERERAMKFEADLTELSTKLQMQEEQSYIIEQKQTIASWLCNSILHEVSEMIREASDCSSETYFLFEQIYQNSRLLSVAHSTSEASFCNQKRLNDELIAERDSWLIHDKELRAMLAHLELDGERIFHSISCLCLSFYELKAVFLQARDTCLLSTIEPLIQIHSLLDETLQEIPDIIQEDEDDTRTISALQAQVRTLHDRLKRTEEQCSSSVTSTKADFAVKELWKEAQIASLTKRLIDTSSTVDVLSKECQDIKAELQLQKISNMRNIALLNEFIDSTINDFINFQSANDCVHEEILVECFGLLDSTLRTLNEVSEQFKRRDLHIITLGDLLLQEIWCILGSQKELLSELFQECDANQIRDSSIVSRADNLETRAAKGIQSSSPEELVEVAKSKRRLAIWQSMVAVLLCGLLNSQGKKCLIKGLIAASKLYRIKQEHARLRYSLNQEEVLKQAAETELEYYQVEFERLSECKNIESDRLKASIVKFLDEVMVLKDMCNSFESLAKDQHGIDPYVMSSPTTQRFNITDDCNDIQQKLLHNKFVKFRLNRTERAYPAAALRLSFYAWIIVHKDAKVSTSLLFS
eukprot:763396-Hanusia_phi.AAC.7